MYQDEAEVAAELKRGGDPNTIYGERPVLSWAAQADSKKVVELLQEPT